MNRKGFTFCSLVCAVLLSAATASTQQPTTIQRGPIPSAILAAKKIFVSNAAIYSESYSGDADRVYNQFFTGLKASNQFELVGDPSTADLVLEVQFTATDNYFSLVIHDSKTHFMLWTLLKPIIVGGSQKTRDRNFDQALTALLSDFLALSGKTPPPSK